MVRPVLVSRQAALKAIKTCEILRFMYGTIPVPCFHLFLQAFFLVQHTNVI